MKQWMMTWIVINKPGRYLLDSRVATTQSPHQASGFFSSFSSLGSVIKTISMMLFGLGGPLYFRDPVCITITLDQRNALP
jgi:hypothetical protein